MSLPVSLPGAAPGSTDPLSPGDPAAVGDPVTVVVRRRVRPGHEEAYEALVSEMSGRLSAMPGHRGTGVIRPAAGQNEYHIVIRFDDARYAASWEVSGPRLEWLSRLAPHILGETSIEQQPGLEFWFTPPERPTLAQPSRWKMTVVTVLALYPTSLLVGVLAGPSLAHLPLALRALLQAAVVVPLMTYVVMPGATRAFRRWLRP